MPAGQVIPADQPDSASAALRNPLARRSARRARPADRAADRTPRWPLLAIFAGFVLLFMLQAPGKLTADTKLDVPLEPWRFMEAATHLWNSTSDFGFLPNQYVGYLFPMGPFFGLGDLLGIPPWITQRLWMALLLTAASWGVVRLADAMGIGRPASRVVAGLGYTLSPMFLGKIGATSVAMAGAVMLPWIVLPLVLALRPDGARGSDTGHADDGSPAARRMAAARLSPRRAGALSGLAVLCTGGVNASVTLCVLVCPAVLLVFAGGTRRAWALRGWWCLSVILATAWWMLALLLQGRYGLNFLPYTETAQTTTASTPVGEALRGATDWLAYLQLPTPWLPAATDYVSTPAAVIGSAVITALGLWGLARADLPARRFLLVTLGAGVVAVSMAYPGEPGSPLADWIRSLLSEQLAFLRNVYKFQPVARLPLALGLAHILGLALDQWRQRRAAADPGREAGAAASGAALSGAAVPDAAGDGEAPEQAADGPGRPTAGGRRRRARSRGGPAAPRLDRPRAVPILVLVVTVGALVSGMTPALAGRALQPDPFKEVPEYWVEAADWLAANPEGGRTLVLPGAPFGEYEWGRPLDEPLQWLARTPWGVRNLIPLGGVGVTRWMDGIERELATGSAPGLAVALTRAGVGQVLIRNDIVQKDWDIPPSTDQIHRALESSGLVLAATFGPEVPARPAAKARLVPELADLDETVPALEVWTVPGGASMIESYPVDTAMIVSGGPEATVQLASQGLLDNSRAVLLASDLADTGVLGMDGEAGRERSVAVASASSPDAPPAEEVMTPTTAWVATDTLTRRDYKYGIVHDSASYLLGPDENVAGKEGPPNQWVDRPVAGHQTVAGYTGGMSVRASSYGYDLLASPELGPAAAVDGHLSTAWMAQRRQGATAQGEWIEFDVGRPVAVPHIEAVFLAEGDWRPSVRAVRVTTEAGSVVTEVEATEEKQRLAVPEGTSRWYRITLERVEGEDDPVLGPGIREVEIPGAHFQWYAQLPSDVTELFGEGHEGQIAYSFSRQRVDPQQPFGGSEEISIARRFEVPRAMTFTLVGTVGSLPPPEGAVPDSDQPLTVPCGHGPTVVIDGQRYQTRVDGRYSDINASRPMRLTLCTEGSRLDLPAGQHLLTIEQDVSTIMVDSITLTAAQARVGTASTRSTLITGWSPERRTVEIGPGERSFFAVRENANASWTATLDGEELTPVRLDGWQQGWIVPAGEGGTLVIENKPGQDYRRNLVIGLLLVVALVVAAVVPERYRLRPRSNEYGYPAYLNPKRVPLINDLERVPRIWVALAVATLAVFLVAGVVALLVPLIVLLGRRRPAALSWIALAGMVGAGIAVAASPNSSPDSGEGAFSWYAQTLGALAFAGAMAALSLPSRHGGEPEEAAETAPGTGGARQPGRSDSRRGYSDRSGRVPAQPREARLGDTRRGDVQGGDVQGGDVRQGAAALDRDVSLEGDLEGDLAVGRREEPVAARTGGPFRSGTPLTASSAAAGFRFGGRDAGTRDAGARDAGPRDGGAPGHGSPGRPAAPGSLFRPRAAQAASAGAAGSERQGGPGGPAREASELPKSESFGEGASDLVKPSWSAKLPGMSKAEPPIGAQPEGRPDGSGEPADAAPQGPPSGWGPPGIDDTQRILRRIRRR